MSLTTIRGQQLRDSTLSRTKIDAAFEASLASIESNVAQIFNTMSTDAERMAAIEAVNTAWQAADGSLQTMITSMVNATKAGAGLETDGTLALPAVTNFLAGVTSLKAATVALDTALKAEEVARITADATLQTTLQASIDAIGTNGGAALAAETAARIAADADLTTALGTETTARTAADADLAIQISNEVAARQLLNTTLSTSLANEASARTAALSAEATTRASADTALQNALDAESLARTSADTVHTASIAQETADRIAADNTEAAARLAGDTALDGRLDLIEAATASTLTYAKIVKREAPVGDVDGVNTVFTVAFDMVAGTEEVFYNGQLLEPGATADYTIVGKVITLAFAPVGTDRVRVSYFR